jgi:hypothetical protein
MVSMTAEVGGKGAFCEMPPDNFKTLATLVREIL